MTLYFAYGSNMSPRQMRRRCPGARPYAAGTLEGWRFHITHRGTANIVRAPGRACHGALYRVTTRHLALLDRWEGVGNRVYRRCWVRVRTGRGPVTALVYVCDGHWPGRGRPDYILTAVLPGARAFGLPATAQAEIAAWLAARPIGAVRLYRGRRSAKRADRSSSR